MLVCPILAAPRSVPVGFVCTLNATVAPVTTAYCRALDQRGPRQLAELRDATLAFVTTLKADGVAPEQVLVSLKRAIERSGWWPSLVPALPLDPELQPPDYRMYSQVFAWFLDGYFG